MMDRTDLLGQLRELGVSAGMNLMVHSSLKRLGPIDGGGDAVIDVLLEAIGPDGTLMTPTLTYSIVGAKQPVFHVDKTPSVVGALTEVFRCRQGAVRSLHPTHSAAAMGPKAEFFTDGQLAATTPCPAESPWGRLMRSDGWILMLGVNMGCNTTIHAMEEEVQRQLVLRDEPEQLFVIDTRGVLHETPQYRHECHYRHSACWPDLEPVLREAGVLTYGRTGNAISRLIHAPGMREIVLPILRDTPERMFVLPG